MNPPDQSPDDVRLARLLWANVRWFNGIPSHNLSAGWEYRDDYSEWRYVPAYGDDQAAAFDALERYCERHSLHYQIDYVPPEGNMPAERYVILQRLGGRDRIVAEGSTFPLAARAAILAMEDQRT